MLEGKIAIMDVDPLPSALWQTFGRLRKLAQISEGLLNSETGILDQEMTIVLQIDFSSLLSGPPIGDQKIRLPIECLETIVSSKGCL
jgi:hypothetical protein